MVSNLLGWAASATRSYLMASNIANPTTAITATQIDAMVQQGASF